MASWAGVVLTGGRGSRLGGVDKAALELAGTSFLEQALQALSDAAVTVVVGEPTSTSRPVEFAREQPPGGGPAAGLLAGVEQLVGRPGPTVELVVVLAVDMPWVDRATLARLLRAAEDPGSDGAVLDDGRPQHLCAAYRIGPLLVAAPAPEERAGLSVRRLVAPLRLAPVAARGREADDVDRPEDLPP